MSQEINNEEMNRESGNRSLMANNTTGTCEQNATGDYLVFVKIIP